MRFERVALPLHSQRHFEYLPKAIFKSVGGTVEHFLQHIARSFER